MKGKKTYTQHSVAWGDQPFRDPTLVDEVNISWAAKGGGTHGEMNFDFRNFGPQNERDNRSHPAVQVKCFTDSIGCLLQPELQGVLRWFNRLSIEKRSAITPAQLIKKLEAWGFVASSYHLDGGRRYAKR